MMKRMLVSTLALTALTTTPVSAHTTSSSYHRHEVRYYYYYPAYQAPTPYVRVTPPRWSVGMHATGLSTNHALNGEALALGGAGMHLRVRGYRWGLELATDVVGNEFAEGGIKRVSVPIQTSGMVYLLPWGRFNVYALAGLRLVPTNVRWDLPNLNVDQSFIEFGGQAGIGAELHLGRRFSLTADVRGFGTIRNSTDPAGKFYKDLPEGQLTPVPDKSAGIQFTAGASVRF